MTSQLIKSIQLTECNAMLLEFGFSTSANCFKTYCKERALLTHICSTTKIQPCTYRLTMKPIPCDSSFAPNKEDQLQAIETEHKPEVSPILLASWIKKPKLHSPNQKTVNVKVVCSSPIMANLLLQKRVFIANARIMIPH